MDNSSLVDTHAHLSMNHFEKDRRDVIDRARSFGVSIIEMGLDKSSSRKAVKLADWNEGISAGVGYHPHEAKRFTKESLSTLERLAENPEVVAIGEIGLDFYRDNSPREDQRQAFRAQLRLAKEIGLPVSIHNRSSTEEMLRIFEEEGDLPPGVIHSFFGDLELANKFLDYGFYLGISGPVTFEGNSELKRTVGEIPLDRLLLETDCPFLTPEPHRGERNEPSFVRYIAHEIAELKGTDFKDIRTRTTENTKALFGLGK